MASNVPPPDAADRGDGNGLNGPGSEGASKSNGRLSTSKPHLDLPLQNAFRLSSDSISRTSTYTIDDGNEGSVLVSQGLDSSLETSPSKRTWKSKWDVFWKRNKGVSLVLLAQFFGGLMNVTIRLLETNNSSGDSMEPFQILLARMSITSLLCFLYMWWADVPHAPFGMKEVRGILVVRGLGGFFGVYGMYYSLEYLPIAEATVITFLAPIVSCWACSLLIHEPFTRLEQLAAGVSLIGVLLIAQPASLFSGNFSLAANATSIATGPATNATSSVDLRLPIVVTPKQHLLAIGMSLIGVGGAACAYTTIRWIGQRAHPLISVNYFASWCTIVSVVVVATVPSVKFRLPNGIVEWAYLIFLGICGFIMQVLLTAGLAHEKSSRATNMVYTQMLFALAFDKIVWDITPGLWSIIGSSLILGSAVYIAIQKDASKAKSNASELRDEEEANLMTDTEEINGDDDEENGGGVQGGGPEAMEMKTIST